MKYKDWLNDWLELYVKPVVKTQTYEKYERNMRIHITPVLGEYAMEQLNAEILQRFVTELTVKFASNTVNSIITVLQKSLKAAVMLGTTDKCYVDKIARPKAQESSLF